MFFGNETFGAAFGLDLAGGHLALARAERHGSKVVFSTVETGNQENLHRIAAECAAGRAAAVGFMGIKETLTTPLTAHVNSCSKAVRVFPALLDTMLPFAIEDCVYEFLNVHKTAENTIAALALAARTADVTKRIEQYKSTGFDPHILRHEGLVLWEQALRECPPPRPAGTRAIIFNSGSSVSVVIGAEGRYKNAFSTTLVPSRTNCTEFAEKLKRFLLAEKIEPMEWVWAAAEEPDATLLTIMKISPPQLIRCTEPELFRARALAASGVLQPPREGNLRKATLTHPLLQKRASSAKCRTAAAWLLPILAVCATNILWRAGMEAKCEAARQAVHKAAIGLLPGTAIPPGLETLELKRALERESLQAAPFKEAMKSSLLPQFFEILKQAAAHEIKIHSFSLSGGRLYIEGNAPTFQHCEKFSSAIAKVGYAPNMETEPGPAGTTAFTLRAEPIVSDLGP